MEEPVILSSVSPLGCVWDTPAFGVPLSLAVSCCAVWWIFRYILRVAVAKDITDSPDSRKLHGRPVPVLGGVAVAFGIVTSSVIAESLFGVSRLCPLVCIMTVMLYTGVMDDILGLSPLLRLVIEILTVLALICVTGRVIGDFHGLWGIGRLPVFLSVPLTVFSCVGVINAVNMIDGVDGLCAGYCIFACAVFGAYCAVCGDPSGAYLSAICVGALLPFLLHNVFGLRSKMFIGDGGTLLMGTVLSCFVTGTLGGDASSRGTVPEGLGLVPFSLSVLAVPVCDTVRVMTARLLHGRSPFMADRTHLHHLLLGLHFSHIGTACAEILLEAWVVGAWWLSYALGASTDMQLYVVLGVSSGVTFGLSAAVARIRRRRPGLYAALLRLGDRTRVGHPKWFLWVRRRMDG